MSVRCGKRRGGVSGNAPLVLLADVILLGQVDEVGNGLGRQEHELVDDVDLGSRV